MSIFPSQPEAFEQARKYHESLNQVKPLSNLELDKVQKLTESIAVGVLNLTDENGFLLFRKLPIDRSQYIKHCEQLAKALLGVK